MSNDRHINFKLLRDRIMRSESRHVGIADGLTSSDQPPATAGGSDKTYWRSLEELADSPIFEEFVQREFPQAAEEWNDPVERRTFLKLMGAEVREETPAPAYVGVRVVRGAVNATTK